MALESDHKAQEKQCHRHSTSPTFKFGDHVMVYMPSETVGKNRKLAQPYHGPYRVVSATPTNTKVKLIQYLNEPTMSVALDRLRKCYLEQTHDCWLGHYKKDPEEKKYEAECLRLWQRYPSRNSEERSRHSLVPSLSLLRAHNLLNDLQTVCIKIGGIAWFKTSRE